MSFGSLCPGKRYALLQLKWFLVSVLSRFELRYQPHQPRSSASAASSPLPAYDCQCHGHEVLPPVADVDIEFRVRQNWTKSRRIQLVTDSG